MNKFHHSGSEQQIDEINDDGFDYFVLKQVHIIQHYEY